MTISGETAIAAPKVICKNSQAKGPKSDETLESRYYDAVEAILFWRIFQAI